MNAIATGIVSTAAILAHEKSQTLRKARLVGHKRGVVLTERHYAFEGDVDSNPGTIIFALPSQARSDIIMNGDGTITHTMPVKGKDRWERRRNIRTVVEQEAAKHGLAVSKTSKDYDGISEERFEFRKIRKPRTSTFRTRFY